MNAQELAALLQEPTLGPFTTDELESLLFHTADRPFCDDLKCKCHDDLALLSQQAGYVDAGLLTSQEFLRMLSGLQV